MNTVDDPAQQDLTDLLTPEGKPKPQVRYIETKLLRVYKSKLTRADLRKMFDKRSDGDDMSGVGLKGKRHDMFVRLMSLPDDDWVRVMTRIPLSPPPPSTY